MRLFRRKEKIYPARCRRHRFWKCVIQTRIWEQYSKKCACLDAAGIDYRVWMYADEPNLVYLREFFGSDPEWLRRYYIVIVRVRDYKKACRLLDVEKDSKWKVPVIDR